MRIINESSHFHSLHEIGRCSWCHGHMITYAFGAGIENEGKKSLSHIWNHRWHQNRANDMSAFMVVNAHAIRWKMRWSSNRRCDSLVQTISQFRFDTILHWILLSLYTSFHFCRLLSIDLSRAFAFVFHADRSLAFAIACESTMIAVMVCVLFIIFKK